MQTVRTLAESCGLSGTMLTALAMMVPPLAAALDKSVAISIDKAAERVRVTFDGRVVLDKTFAEVNAYDAQSP